MWKRIKDFWKSLHTFEKVIAVGVIICLIGAATILFITLQNPPEPVSQPTQKQAEQPSAPTSTSQIPPTPQKSKFQEYLYGLKIGGYIVGVILIPIGIIGLVWLMAKNDFLFTFVEEGTAKVIMKFDAFHRIIMQYQNCTCREGDDWEILLSPKKSKKRFFDGKKKFWGGLCWIGIPGIYSIYSYWFRWATVKTQKKPGEQIDRREEKLWHIFVKDYLYLAEIFEAETKSLVPLDISFLITARVVNPYKALFRIHDWANVIVARMEAYFRQYVGNTEYQDIVKNKQQMGGQIMEALGETGMLEEPENKPTEIELNRLLQGDLPQEEREEIEEKVKKWKGIFWYDYGVKVKNIEMREITPSGENQKVIQEAATKQWVAARQQEQVLTLADAEVQRVDRVYRKINEFGENGLQIRTLEALESAGNKQGNWVAFPFNLMERLFGKGGNK